MGEETHTSAWRKSRLIERRVGLAPFVAGLVTLASCAPRIMLAAGTLPSPFRPFVWSDPLLTYVRGLSGHRLPNIDTPFEYPPLLAFLSGAFSLAVSSPTAYVVCWSLLLAAAAAIAAHALARATTEKRALLYWSLSPQLFLLAGINFDVLPVLMLTLAALAQRSGRELSAAVALAAGTATKLFPLASAPIALLRDTKHVRATATFGAALVIFYAPTLFLPISSASGLAFYATGIPANLDSVWGLVQRALDVMSVPSPSVIVAAITVSGLGVTYIVHVLPRAVRTLDPAEGFGLATVVLMFWSRLYSPQYSLWLLPFFVLLPLGIRRFALLGVADAGVFVTIYPLTLVPHAADDALSLGLLGALAGFVALRQLVLVSCWRVLASGRPRSSIVSRPIDRVRNDRPGSRGDLPTVPR